MGLDKNGMHDRIPPGGPALVQAQERFLFALGLFTGTWKRAPDAPTQWISVSTWGGARVKKLIKFRAAQPPLSHIGENLA